MSTRPPTEVADEKRTNGRSRPVTAALVVLAAVGLALAAVPAGSVAGLAPVPLPVSDLAGGSTGDSPGALAAADDRDGCGDRTTVTHEGRLSNRGERFTYSLAGADNCTLTVALTGPPDADFDLYLAVDGRRVAPDDYDRESTGPGSTELIVLEAAELRDADEVEILVDPYRGAGEYRLQIVPDGTDEDQRTERGDSRDEGDADQGPIQGWYSPRNPQPGETITFVGEPLTGDAEFRWDLDGDGGVDATGRTVTYAFADEGRHEVTLTVEAGDGTETYTTTVLVGSPDDEEDEAGAPSLGRTDGVTGSAVDHGVDPAGSFGAFG